MNDWQIRLHGVSGGEISFVLSELARVICGHARREPRIGAEDGSLSTVHLSVRKDGVPENGYRIKVETPASGMQHVFIEGDSPISLGYGVMDFCHRYLPRAAISGTVANPYYYRKLFSDDFLPPAQYAGAPRILHRGLWTWGLAVYDWRGYLENMVRLRLNEVIFWNDFAPLNGREIVSYAHTLGIRVIWGYAWGWDTTMRLDTSEEASQRIVETYEREYAPIGGDGIYFQSFTETSRETLDGVLIAEAAVGFVNCTASRLLEKHPGLRLQFGLHADSVKNHLDVIARVDPRVEIIWENCGGFPYHSCAGTVSDTEAAKEFTEKLLALRPGAAAGAVFKGMTQLNWPLFKHQTGPEMLGCAGQAAIESRLPSVKKIWRYISGEWLDHGEICRDIMRLYAGQSGTAVYALVEDGLFEKEIPLPAALYAELAWDCDQDWRILRRDVLERADISV
ncbi:MAG: hypothetical protein IKI24_01780 [Clostridia bacterium]|nr:hypothetical protein [Clostridia bacterium]